MRRTSKNALSNRVSCGKSQDTPTLSSGTTRRRTASARNHLLTPRPFIRQAPQTEPPGERLKPHCQQSQPARIRATALCSRTARLPALILSIASGQAADSLGRRGSSRHTKPPASKKAGNIEVYGEKHYLTITTKHLQGTPATVNSRQTKLAALYASLVPVLTAPNERQNTVGGHGAVPRTELPPEAAHDPVLQKLLRGDISGYTSQSSADFVLIMKLLHWTGDNIALTRQLFRESGLYRQKTERKTGETTYLDMTIANALKKRRNPPMKR